MTGAPGMLASSDFGLTFGLEWVALAIVVVVIVRYVVPVVRRWMNARAEAIHAELAAADQARLASEQLVATRTTALEEAKAEAAAIVARAHQDAGRVVAEGRARADAEYARDLTRAEVAIDLARAQVREEVIQRVGALVASVAAKIVAAELDDRSHHKLIGEAIAAAESEGAG